MKTYHVSFMVVYDDIVSAKSPQAAARMVADDCPYDIDGSAVVTDTDTGIQVDVYDFEG